MAFSIFTKLRIRHHIPLWNIFIILKRNHEPVNCHPLPIRPLTLATTHLLPVHTELPVLDILYK